MRDEDERLVVQFSSKQMQQSTRIQELTLYALMFIGVGLFALGIALIWGIYVLDVNDIPSKFVHYLEGRI